MRLASLLSSTSVLRQSSLMVAVIVGAAALLPLARGQTTISAASNSNYNASSSGSYILNSGDTRAVTSGATEAITIGGASGSYTLQINGTAAQTATGRGIRSSTGAAPITINVGSSGLVRAVADDAIQGRNTGTFNLTNLGTLYSGPNISATPSSALTTGRGLNLRDAGGGTVTNGSAANATALIRADGGDAVRVGSGFTFTNYGTINAAGIVNDASTNNVFNTAPLSTSTATTYNAGAGFSFEDISASVGAINSTLYNYGTITGARHGVQAGTAGSNLSVVNYSDGTIIGRNGSGVGFDTTTTDPAKVTVTNYGIIRGDYAGNGNVYDRTGNLSPTQDGDGDGIDIDGAATITNYATGQILSTGAGGYDSSGRANNSEAISIGGGVIDNYGLIRGESRGIIVNDDSRASRSGVAATTITNRSGATIEGQNGFAIRLENKWGDARDNDTIVNSGTIIGNGSVPDANATVTIQGGATDTNSAGTLDGVTYTGTGSARFIRGDGSAIQMGQGDDVVTNYGTITGNNGRAINMEGGNDTVNFLGGTITGSIDGGTGTNTLNLGASISHSGAIANFQQINVASGSATLGGTVTGTTLTKGGAGTLELTGDNSYSGDTTVNEGTLRVNNLVGSATSSGYVTIAGGATLGGNGSINGSVVASGIIAPGNSIGTLRADTDVTWNGSTANAWQFELGTGGVSDRLLIGRDFLKGTGSDFVFDFSNTGATGTYTLVDWSGSTSFSLGDFSYINLSGGLVGTFAFNGSQLDFTVSSAIPEPSTYAVLAGALGLAFAAWRRRARRT